MNAEVALLDSSVWIRYLRPRGEELLKAAVREVLHQGRVATCWAIRTELLVGARDDHAFAQLLEALQRVPDVALTPEIWVEAARLGYRLRQQGLLVPLPDLLVAQCAIAGGLTLWHADEHFEWIRSHSTLQTRSWLTP
jgi:predicted nucleic acid-binding protein